jgi:hypothetical protein
MISYNRELGLNRSAFLQIVYARECRTVIFLNRTLFTLFSQHREKDPVMNRGLHTAVIVSVFVSIIFTEGSTAELPKATQKVLSEIELDPNLMNGIDAELKVPQAWLDGAAKEEEVVILGNMAQQTVPCYGCAFSRALSLC